MTMTIIMKLTFLAMMMMMIISIEAVVGKRFQRLVSKCNN